MTAIAATLQAFFTERLISQRRASPHTISSSPTWSIRVRATSVRNRKFAMLLTYPLRQ